MNKTKINIIIPTFNAAASIELLTRLLFQELREFQMTIIFVDDASRDTTPQLIGTLAKEYGNIRHHFSERNQGQQASLHKGLKMMEMDCDYVITMDDDLQNPVETIRPLMEKIQAGYDLVYAIPEISGNSKEPRPSLLRQIGSGLRDRTFDSFMNKPKDIRVSAFRIMTRELALKTAASQKKFFYLSAESFQHKVRVANVWYPFVPRHGGKSSYTGKRLAITYVKLLLTYKLKII